MQRSPSHQIYVLILDPPALPFYDHRIVFASLYLEFFEIVQLAVCTL